MVHTAYHCRGPLAAQNWQDDPDPGQRFRMNGPNEAAEPGQVMVLWGTGLGAIAAADTVTAALDLAPDLNTVFPASQLGTQLQTVAQLIAVRDELGMQRQVFFVGAGGFDSHDNQNDDQPGLLGGVSDAMAAFYDATVELNVASNVTAFTQSDFGRTLTSNGDGTDHAWGGNQLVVGGAVNGGDLYGSYPSLELNGPEDVGGGRIIPSTSADQYAATLAGWFGIPETDLDIVAPNLPNFLQRDLGFMI